jgi:hypothetical protein
MDREDYPAKLEAKVDFLITGELPNITNAINVGILGPGNIGVDGIRYGSRWI